MAMSQRNKYILSFIGTFLFHFGFSSVQCISNLSVYITSYIHLKQTWISMHYGNFFMPFMTFAITIFAPLSGYSERTFGPKMSIMFGGLITFFATLGFFYQQNIFICYILIIVIGFGNGISIAIPNKNLISYKPDKKGFINSILICFQTITIPIYIFIGEKIINPQGLDIEKDKKFYNDECALNSRKIYYIILIMVPLGCLFGILLFFPYQSDEEMNKNEQISLLEETETKTSNENDLEKENESEEKQYSINLRKAIKSKRLKIIGGIAFSIIFQITFVLNTFRTFGALININGQLLQYLFIVIGLALLIFGPIWGILVDKYGGKIILFLISIISIITGILFEFFIENDIMFAIILTLNAICIAGINTSITPHIMHVFGIKYYLERGGLIGIYGGISILMSSITAFVISLFYENKPAKAIIFPYKMITIFGIQLSVIASLLSYYESEKQFDYNEITDIGN